MSLVYKLLLAFMIGFLALFVYDVAMNPAKSAEKIPGTMMPSAMLCMSKKASIDWMLREKASIIGYGMVNEESEDANKKTRGGKLFLYASGVKKAYYMLVTGGDGDFTCLVSTGAYIKFLPKPHPLK